MLRDERSELSGGAGAVGRLDAMQTIERGLHRGLVSADDLGATSAVGLRDGRVDAVDRELARQDAGECEEARLQNRVRPAREACVACELPGVDRIQRDP